MERGSIARWLFLGVGLFLFMQYGYPAIFGSDEPTALQPLGPAYVFPDEATRAEEQKCTIGGERYEVVFSTRGASLRSAKLLDPKYVTSVMVEGAPQADLVTTNPNIPGVWESRMPLRTDIRVPLADDSVKQQVQYDDLDWKLAESNQGTCVFTYEDDDVLLTKTITTSGRPFEMNVEFSIENRAKEARSHRYTIEQTSFRTAEETEGSLGRLSEYETRVVAHTDQGTERMSAGDFDADEFENEGFTSESWYRAPGTAKWASTSSSYMSSTVIHVEGPAAPAAELLIEENFNAAQFPNKSNDPNYGHTYRSRLAYPTKELGPSEAVTYKSIAFLGPKERAVLAGIGGTEHGVDSFDTGDIIDLGFFGAIGRILVDYIYWLHKLVGNWGWAICLLTITVKMGLFPLSIAQIKSSIAMRRLKPEMDELNKKYKDDATQRGLALQELWKREKVSNPVMGCLPLLLQMPVWFALYTVLQTAVELYHTPFGPFIPDMSEPGLYYIIPAVLGASSFLQQRLMPPQGDPAQQKMMMYAMPAMFTVFMLFLPAGLGVYMLTNTWLGILQTLAVERFMKSRTQNPGSRTGEIKVTEKKVEDKKPSGDAGRGTSKTSGKGRSKSDKAERSAAAAESLGRS